MTVIRRGLPALALAIVAVLLWNNLGTQLFINLGVAGLTAGAIAAISGLGVVVTYKATGVFNFAHGAMAVFVAYVLWQMTQEWSIPLGISAPVALLLVGPGLGILMERLVFRPLAERDASAAENLVATIGVFVVLLGVMTAIWGLGTKNNPVSLFPRDGLCLGACGADASGLSVRVGADQLGSLGMLLISGIGLYWLFSRSRLGLDIKAVVDRRELAQLTAVDANRVSMVAWGLGAGFAGLGGVLLAPTATGSLDPFRLTLLVIETFAVAVLARLTSLPRAIAAGLGLGLLSSYLTTFSLAYPVTWIRDGLDWLPIISMPDASGLARTAAQSMDSVIPNIPVFILLGALLFMRNLSMSSGGGAGSFVARVAGTGSSSTLRAANAVLVLVVAIVAVGLPFGIRNDLSLMRNAHQMLALAIIFLSIVIVTGFSGHITLAQAGFAGVGALAAARVHNAGVPVILSLVIGGLVCIPIGAAAGYPALRRRGLFLGLTTLALGLVLERGLLQNSYFVGNASATTFDDPSLFGLDLGGGLAFYFYALTVLALSVVLARNLRRSRLGRILGAMRDSEEGARSVALNLRAYKLLVFCIGSFLAGTGGALLSQSTGTYSPEDYVAINSLLWFAVVVVAGVGSIYGALLGAFLLTMLDSMLGNAGGALLVIGLAAVSLGRLPGGLIGGIRRLATAGPGVLLGTRPGDSKPAARAGVLQPSHYAREVLAARRGGAA